MKRRQQIDREYSKKHMVVQQWLLHDDDADDPQKHTERRALAKRKQLARMK
ncbi:hypothetical protein D3C80_2157610 [compost metagenome]